MTKKKKAAEKLRSGGNYSSLLGSVSELLEQARRQSARTVNTVLTATYWQIGQRIVEYEQSGLDRAKYGEKLLQNLANDLIARFGRGFSVDNLETMRLFYQAYPDHAISETPSRKLGSKKSETASRIFTERFGLTWSHYVILVRRTATQEARRFYEAEALRGGWSVRQLDRQIASQFYERTALSTNKTAMLKKGGKPLAGELPSAEEEIKEPYVLEFLGLKDEYSENDLEEALIQHLERFLLELGGNFAFIGRQRRLRVGNEWYRIDLLFFHRTLRCLVIIDLKVGKFTHADAGQMHLYLNYAREHWVNDGENPPVGLILCAEKDSAVAKYALEGLPNKVLAAEYKLALPDEKRLVKEMEQTQKVLLNRRARSKHGNI